MGDILSVISFHAQFSLTLTEYIISQPVFYVPPNNIFGTQRILVCTATFTLTHLPWDIIWRICAEDKLTFVHTLSPKLCLQETKQ